MKKLTKAEWNQVFQSIGVVVLLVLGYLGYVDAPAGNEATARGTTTNFTDLDLSGTFVTNSNGRAVRQVLPHTTVEW